MKKLVIFASGTGSNADAIMDFFSQSKQVKVCMVMTNNKDAKVLEKAKRHAVPSLVFDRLAFAKANYINDLLQAIDPDLIILAGFLWKIPESMVAAFPDKIINIHPALLPAYGGKGMYGMHVHRAIIDNKEKESGITIHYVNKQYDEGAIIKQARVEIEEKDTAEDLAAKIHVLEHAHFAPTIAQLLN